MANPAVLAGEVPNIGQLAKIWPFWPEKGQIPTRILPLWQRQGRPALQISRCSRRPSKSRRPEPHLPTEKREEEEPKREGERWLKNKIKKIKGENVKSGSKKWMRDFGRKNSIFLSQE